MGESQVRYLMASRSGTGVPSMSEMDRDLSVGMRPRLRVAFHIGRVALCCVIALATTHCGSSKSSSTPAATYKVTPPVVGTDRFPHDKHTGGNPEIAGYKGKGLFCGDCHDPEQVKAGKTSRPGLLQHAPCDDCHKAEFAKPPGIFCKVCHVSVDPRKAGNSPLESYPARGATQALAAVFSHKLHLDSGRMEDAAGFHLDCADCHVRDQERDPTVPQHPACARCHEQSPAAKAKLAMENCTGCHPKGEVDLKRGRIFITADLKFAHAKHEKDRAGNAVRCTVCHIDIARSSNRNEVSVPAMERCATCHEDRQRSPDRVRMSKCNVCHSAVLTGEPPTNHMLATGQQPADHGRARQGDGERPEHHRERLRADAQDLPERECRPEQDDRELKEHQRGE